jgi:AraC-like DNA-binding protein
VARAVGFAGAQHLCDVFKRITGVTPGGWRQGQGR